MRFLQYLLDGGFGFCFQDLEGLEYVVVLVGGEVGVDLGGFDAFVAEDVAPAEIPGFGFARAGVGEDVVAIGAFGGCGLDEGFKLIEGEEADGVDGLGGYFQALPWVDVDEALLGHASEDAAEEEDFFSEGGGVGSGASAFDDVLGALGLGNGLGANEVGEAVEEAFANRIP